MQRVGLLPSRPPFFGNCIAEINLAARFPIDVNGSESDSAKNARIGAGPCITEEEHCVFGSARLDEMRQIIDGSEIEALVVDDVREMRQREEWRDSRCHQQWPSETPFLKPERAGQDGGQREHQSK